MYFVMNQTIKTHLSNDEILKPIIDKIESLSNSVSTGDLYVDLVRTIVFQQLSGKAATTIFNRFLNLFEDGYPRPDLILELDIPALRAVGLSRPKAGYIQNIATFAQAEKWAQKDWTSFKDDELIKYLTQIKGVGKWTAQMILMFTLDRPDVLPLDDLVVRNMMIELYQVEGTKKEVTQQLTQIAEPWRPYRSFASRCLWQWKDTVL